MQNNSFLWLLFFVFLSGCNSPLTTESKVENFSETCVEKTKDAGFQETLKEESPKNELFPTWKAELSVESVENKTVGKTSFASSTQLKAKWKAHPKALSYRLLWEEKSLIEKGSLLLPSPKTEEHTIQELKSATQYRFRLDACLNQDCSQIESSSFVEKKTSEEVWQFQGTGNSYSGLQRVVSDGNVIASVFPYEQWGPHKGKMRMYYNPKSGDEKGLKIGLSKSILDDTQLSTLFNFDGFSGFGMIGRKYGDKSPYPPAIGTFHVVPLKDKIRVFFEGELHDNVARVASIDSKDGLEGVDFSSGSPTICKTAEDFQPGGSCEYKIILGTENDTGDLQNKEVKAIRQLKVGYPTLDNWIWQETKGTFMIVTLHFSSTKCSPTFFNAGLAQWDGTKWKLQYNGDCPKSIPYVQAPSLVHLGQSRYKLYYNFNEMKDGQPHNPLTNPKVMKVLYINGKTTGDVATVEFEDLEEHTQHRDLTVLWPDGTKLTDQEESRMDDHSTLMPTNNPKIQVFYTNMSGEMSKNETPIIASVLLLNP